MTVTHLQIMALCRIRELQNEAFEIHCQLEIWRETPLTSVERTKMSVEMKEFLIQADTWARAILGSNFRIGHYPHEIAEGKSK